MMETAELQNPYAARLAAQHALLTDAGLRSQAQRDQQLGLLGKLSGDAALGEVGQALLARAARQQQREDERLTRLEDRSTAWDSAHAEARARERERREERDRQRSWQGEQNALMRNMLGGNQGLVQAIHPNTGQPVWMPRQEAIGQQPVPAGGGQPSEDERKAAGWLTQANTAFANMQQAIKDDPSAAQPTTRELAIGAVPGVGQGAAYAAMSPARQRFTTAASSLSEAILRAATGAGVNKDEALQKVQELTPRWGEHPDTTSMKQQMAAMYLQALEARAGRAAPQAPRTTNFPRARAAGAASAPSGGGWSIQREP
jgi:hypothetical protein